MNQVRNPLVSDGDVDLAVNIASIRGAKDTPVANTIRLLLASIEIGRPENFTGQELFESCC